jgi:hypothetical protein
MLFCHTLYLSLILRIPSICETKSICANTVRTNETCLIQEVLFSFISYEYLNQHKMIFVRSIMSILTLDRILLKRFVWKIETAKVNSEVSRTVRHI